MPVEVALPATVRADATSRILGCLCNGLGFESAELWLSDPGGGVLHRCETWSSPALVKLGEGAPSAMEYLSPGILARVCQSGSAVWTHQRSFQHNWARLAYRDLGIRGVLCSAIRRHCKNCGVIILFSRSAEAPAMTILDLIAEIGAQIGEFLGRD